MTREENLHWIDQEIRTWENECQSKHPIKEALYAARKALEQEPRWIPVAERLPENAKHKGALCPKYYVMTEYGVTEGWYNPDVKCWYALLWFMDVRFEEWNINIDKGDIPKLVKNVPVIAWMPLPEPYEGGE